MGYYNRQAAEFEESAEHQQEVYKSDKDENLDVNYDKDIANVKFTIESMRAVTEPFFNKIDDLLQESCEETNHCL